MIQAVITRIAGNSFALKRAAVTLTTDVVGLLGAIGKPNGLYLAAGVLPVALFWWLDAKGFAA
jgi:hypothetical protein